MSGHLSRARTALAALVCVAVTGAPATTRAAATEAQIVRAGPRDCAQLALTFDLCPAKRSPGFDAGLVALLIEKHVPATFFASGRWVRKHDAELRSLAAVQAFEIGTHGANHAHLAGLAASAQRMEIGGAVDLLHEHYGIVPTLFRPPYGEYDATTLAVAGALGQRVVLWDVVSDDPDPHISLARMWQGLEQRTRAGSIVIFHANGNGHHTQEAVERMIDELAPARHLTFVTVSKLIEGCAAPAGAGSP